MSDALMRRVLQVSAVFNLGAGMAFAYPSLARPLIEVPDAPALYRSLSAYLIILFGACYFWLSRQALISRELVVLGALGKIGAFVLFGILWTMGQAPFLIALAGVGDLILGCIFLYWFKSTRALAT